MQQTSDRVGEGCGSGYTPEAH